MHHKRDGMGNKGSCHVQKIMRGVSDDGACCRTTFVGVNKIIPCVKWKSEVWKCAADANQA
jgi:hypothetical protein